MENKNIILTGIPRSGTTLTCHILNKFQNTVALHEPMNVESLAALPNRNAICGEISTFFGEARRTLVTDREVISKQRSGAVPDNPVGEHRTASGLRLSNSSRGVINIDKELSPEFYLVIKHPSAFTALLQDLVLRFPCYAAIRNPLSVLASWSSVAMPVENGHAPAAESFDTELRLALGRIKDKTDRQLHLLSWFYEQYHKFLPAECVLRYEDLVASRGESLQIITPHALTSQENLESKNKNPLYNKELMRSLCDKILATDGAYWRFYTKESVEMLCK